MPSSRTEPNPLAVCYSEAFKALLQGSLKKVGTLFEQADLLLASIDLENLGAETREEITASYGRLMSALKNEHESTSTELKKLRRGKKQLSKMGFRPTADMVGTNVHSKA